MPSSWVEQIEISPEGTDTCVFTRLPSTSAGRASSGCPSPSFPPLLPSVTPSSFLPPLAVSSVAEGLTPVWHVGWGSVNLRWVTEWVLKDRGPGHSHSPPSPPCQEEAKPSTQVAQGSGGVRTRKSRRADTLVSCGDIYWAPRCLSGSA